MPSPFGEGQTDMPINHHHLGEVRLDGNTAIAGYRLSMLGYVRDWVG